MNKQDRELMMRDPIEPEECPRCKYPFLYEKIEHLGLSSDGLPDKVEFYKECSKCGYEE